MAKFTGPFDAEYEHKKELHQQQTNHERFMMLKNKEKRGKQTIHGKENKFIRMFFLEWNWIGLLGHANVRLLI